MAVGPRKAALRTSYLLVFRVNSSNHVKPYPLPCRYTAVTPRSPFEKFLRFRRARARLSFHLRHRAASGRAWWATSLAARPPSGGRLAHSRSKGSQTPHPPCFTLYIQKAKFTKPRPISSLVLLSSFFGPDALVLYRYMTVYRYITNRYSGAGRIHAKPGNSQQCVRCRAHPSTQAVE